jgi:hypothetical protein
MTSYTYRAQTDPSTKHWHLGAVERGLTSFCGNQAITPEDTRPWALRVPLERRHIETADEIALVDCGKCLRLKEWGYAHGTPRPAETTGTRRTRRSPATTHASAASIEAAMEAGSASLTRAEADRMAADAAERNGHEPRPSEQRAALDARVLALLRTYPARTRHPIADLRTAMDPAPTMPKLKASLGRWVKAGKVTLDSGGYAVAPDADAVLAMIDAAVADATGEPPVVVDDRPGAATADPAPHAPEPATGTRRTRRAKTGDPRQDRAKDRPLSRAAKARALVDAGECATLKDARAYLADMGE